MRCFAHLITRRTLVCLAAVLACLVATSIAEADDSSRPHFTIVTLGDSITKGVRSGVTAEQTFSSLLQSQLGESGISADVVNLGIGGERADQGFQRLDRILELSPDLVTVMYGTNDSYIDKDKTTSRISVDEYRANLTNIVKQLRSHGIEPVLMTEPRWADEAAVDGSGSHPNLSLEPFVVACREVAQGWRVPLVDHFAYWTKARSEGTHLRQWTTDNCHPNPDGHRELARLMLPIIRQRLGSRGGASDSP